MASDKKIDKKYVETPLMKQYYSIKAVHPDAILLFRVGDFYETFGDDAIKASGILGITLTRRANGSATYVELAGFPYHAIDTYLPKLVRAGERVAICEQLEDPKQVRGLVKRGVIELVTPGVVLGDNILANKENAFLASVYFGRQTTGVAFLDISTGEFYVAEGSESYIDKLISNLAPKEVIYQRGYEDRFSDAFGSKLYTYRLDEWVFSEEVNREKLCKQFGTRSLKGFGVDHFTSGLSAAGAILYYLEFTEHRDIAHITSISRIDQEDYVWVDKFTIRNLELFSSNGAREKCSFADVIDRTLTPMGGRLLKRWIAMPIKDPVKIGERLDVVEKFVRDADLADVVREQVALVGDMERIASRIAAARVTPRELVQLKNSLFAVELLKAALESTDDAQLHALAGQIDLLEGVRDRIARELAAEGVRIFRAGLWKPRTKPGGFEGVGAEGVAWLRRVKRETGMYTATEVATRKHVMAALEGGIDMIWIGARTTANPFAMQEIADALRGHDIPVLVKNPVSPDLELWIGGVERIYNAGIRRLGGIHRGFTSIDKSLYRNHPMWSIPIELHRRLPGLQIFCDPSHIGGRRELIAPLSQQAMDLGFDGLIIEAHCSPDCAWSDKAQQVTPEALAYIIRNLVIRDESITTESLTELRSQIDKLDDQLLELLSRRMRVSRDIGQYKKEHNMPVLQTQRYEELLARRAGQAGQMGMDREFMRTVLQAIHEESIRQQMEVLGK